MGRLLTILLIPLLLVGQPIPHSHVETGLFEPDDHDHRPHFHWNSHAKPLKHRLSKGHSFGTRLDGDKKRFAAIINGSTNSCGISDLPMDDHDSDAIYLAIGSSTESSRPESEAFEFEVGVIHHSYLGFFAWQSEERHRYERWRPPDVDRGPIYLLTASLRL